MKKYCLIVCLMVLMSCNGSKEKQPVKLIEKDVMVKIMYEMAIFNAVKVQKPISFENYDNNFFHYIKKKYKVDSTQFVQSNSYYAKNYKEYKKMFEEVVSKVDIEKKIVDSLIALKNIKIKKQPKRPTLKKEPLKSKLFLKRLEEAAKKDNEGIVN